VRTLAPNFKDAGINTRTTFDNLIAHINYDGKDRATMVFDKVCQVVDDPRSEERRLWASPDGGVLQVRFAQRVFQGNRSSARRCANQR